MNTTTKLLIGILLLIFISILYIDLTKPVPVNWEPSFKLEDKAPYGLYIFDHEVEHLLKNKSVERIYETAYEHFSPLYNYDSLVDNYEVKGTILAISKNYSIDEESTKELFYFVGHGNSAFISAEDFSKTLKDSLNFDNVSEFGIEKGLYFSLANPKLTTAKNFLFKEGIINTYFSEIDTSKTTVLGYQSIDNKTKEVNFIKVPYKAGFFYLHTQPSCFTNIHLLKGNHYQYTEGVSSYIPKKSSLFLLANERKDINQSSSPLRYIFSHPPLKWAWLIGLLGVIIFMIFNAKRKQRIVPIIKPLENTTVDFTKTIGNLYYQEGNHQNIIDKKIIYFLEKIRTEYLIDTQVLDERFIKKLHLKTGKNPDDIAKVIQLINHQKNSNQPSSEQDLIEINNAIEKFLQ